jgi:hypothetical protein
MENSREKMELDRLRLRAECQRSLPPEAEVPLTQRLAQSFGVGHIWAVLKALQEHSQTNDGRLFTVCINLHSQKVAIENALKAHNEAVAHLARRLWYLLNMKMGTKTNNGFLSKAARGSRPLSVFVPAVEDECFHTHGVLMVPKQVGGGLKESQLMNMLSTFGASQSLHIGAVHLAPILPVDSLESVANYMFTNLNTLPQGDRTIMFAPFGRNVVEDWDSINRRADELVTDLDNLEQLQAHRRANRKNLLVKTAWEPQMESSTVRTGQRGTSRSAPGLVPVPKRPTETPRLPRNMGVTGIVRWDGGRDSRGVLPKRLKKET